MTKHIKHRWCSCHDNDLTPVKDKDKNYLVGDSLFRIVKTELNKVVVQRADRLTGIAVLLNKTKFENFLDFKTVQAAERWIAEDYQYRVAQARHWKAEDNVKEII